LLRSIKQSKVYHDQVSLELMKLSVCYILKKLHFHAFHTTVHIQLRADFLPHTSNVLATTSTPPGSRLRTGEQRRCLKLVLPIPDPVDVRALCVGVPKCIVLERRKVWIIMQP